MKSFLNNHMDLKRWLFFTGLATVVLFFVSPDSYLNDMHSRADSAWFFMCGKAWMNGLVPYVDFADSKGPLLWLIYGIGYLLSQTSYVGIYWISCIWYGLTYFFTYKIADIFLKDARKSMACTVLMTLAFFSSWYHNEIRAEDFCLLFLVISLYRTCLLLYSEQGERERLISFGILGACFAALFLIKYNLALMQAVFIIFALLYLFRNKINVWKPLVFCLSGFLAVSLPFFSYFLFVGNLSAFIQEYILNTLQATSIDAQTGTNILINQIKPTNTVLTYLLEWGDLVYCPGIAALLALILLGDVLFMSIRKEYRWMPMLASVCIFALSVRHHSIYYFQNCSFLLVFLFIVVFSLIDKTLSRRAFSLCTLFTLCVAISFHILSYNFKILIFNDNINQRDYYKTAYILSQVDKPKIVNAYTHEYGFGVIAKALPAGKYWAGQAGMTDKMRQSHKDLILSGQADFIIIHQAALNHPDCVTEDQLAEAGYYECLRIGEGRDFVLLSNREYLVIPERVSLSRKQLFLKCNPFK